MSRLSMLRRYPLLIPDPSFTQWEGFLKIKENDYKIKVSCPEFPFIRNSSLEIDDKLVHHVPNHHRFISKLKSKKSLKLTAFLDILVGFLEDNIPDSPINFHANFILLKDLENIQEHVVDISDCLDLVELTYEDNAGRLHKMAVHLDPRGNKALDLDLPEEIARAFSQVNSVKSISGLYKSFCSKLDELQALFFMCDLLDHQTTVLDPVQPSRKHIHRRVAFSESVSLEIKLNPNDVYSCPSIEVIGEDTAVANVKTTLEQNMKEMGWDEDLNIIENLSRLLDIDEFPDLQVRLDSTQAQLGEGECSICLSMRHSVTMETPVKLCSNEKCASYYHEICLSKWLQSIPTSDIGFGMVTGKCPHCKMTLTCRLIDDDDDDDNA